MDPSFYREWLDSFFSRDIQGLFAFHAPEKFNALFDYLLRQSGGLFETAKAASGLGISRPTITAHLRALEITQAVTILRPFSGGGQKELTKMPKVYAFDTAALKAFRALHPGGKNYVISPVAGDGYVRRSAGLEFTVCDPTAWAARSRIPA